jgi:hypothetical protein
MIDMSVRMKHNKMHASHDLRRHPRAPHRETAAATISKILIWKKDKKKNRLKLQRSDEARFMWHSFDSRVADAVKLEEAD